MKRDRACKNSSICFCSSLHDACMASIVLPFLTASSSVEPCEFWVVASSLAFMSAKRLLCFAMSSAESSNICFRCVCKHFLRNSKDRTLPEAAALARQMLSSLTSSLKSDGRSKAWTRFLQCASGLHLGFLQAPKTCSNWHVRSCWQGMKSLPSSDERK